MVLLLGVGACLITSTVVLPNLLVVLGLERLSHAPRVGQRLARSIGWLAQRRAERHHAQIRRDLLSADERLQKALGFSGPPE